MLLGIAIGWDCHEYTKDAAAVKDIASYSSIVTDIFLCMTKMIIVPLVFSTPVTGLASTSGGHSMGRVDLRAMIWFVCASATSLALGMLLVDFFQPGVHMNLALSDASAVSGLKTGNFALKAFTTHVFPHSIVEAMAIDEILQILVFSSLFDVAPSTIKNPIDSVIGRGLEELAKLVLHITDYVMRFVPLGVSAAMTIAIAAEGVGILWAHGKLTGEFYLGLILLWVILFLVGYVLLDRLLGRLLGLTYEPTLLVLATASSESVYPKTTEALDRFGVPKRTSSFVLSLGCSFNLGGSMMYQALAVLFITQAYNIKMSSTQQVVLLLVSMLTSGGVAGVMRASLAVVTATLSMFHLPEAGLLLIIGVDQFFDMGRMATNVIGNNLATAVVVKYEPAEDEAAADVAKPTVQPTVG